MIEYLAGALLIVAALLVAMLYFIRSRLRGRRFARTRVRQLWEWLYALDWGGVTTNNFGFAPATGDGPEKFQLQMYMELLEMARASGRLGTHTDLLEVSCGRGGGLASLIPQWPGSLHATALDGAANAVRECRKTHGHIDGLAFVHGSALALPFPDRAFDVVLNVEASNDYGDHGAFFHEVHRVLRPGGLFLYCDSRRAEKVVPVEQMMRDAGLIGEMRDITDNVVEACRLDSPRRSRLIQKGVPWPLRLLFRKELQNYAAIAGSRKFERFRTRARIYQMTCAVRDGDE